MTIIIPNKSNSSSDEMDPEIQSPKAHPNTNMEVSMDAAEDEVVDQPSSWRSIFSFTKREHGPTLAISLILAAISGIIKPAISIFAGKIINDLAAFAAGNITAAHVVSEVSKWCLYITAFGGISWILNGTFFSMWLVFGEMQAKSAREELFDSMLKKDMSWYDLRSEGIGALLSRIAAQIRDLQISASQPFGYVMGDIGTACAALGIAFYNSWKLTLVTLAGLPIALVLLGQISKQMKVNIEAQKRNLTQASKFANTAIISIDTVKAYNGQEHEVWQYASAIKHAARSYLKQANSNALQMGITRFVILSMFVQGFWYGVSLVDKGLSVGAVLTTFYACLMATEAAETLLPQWLVIARGMSAGATLKNLLLQMRNGRRVLTMGGYGTPHTCFGDIEVNNVSFSYPSNPHQLALDKTNFFFPAGETTFVLGKSGSGKSTLSNLLLKFYEPSSGDVSIDGESIQTLNATWLRENVTLVQQQSALFDGSIYQNIALGSSKPESVTRDDVNAACQASMLQGVLKKLKRGLDTNVGAGGKSMSGGQTQRIALARARIRDTPILILDEATSALDQISKSLVMDSIREWRQGKTTIIITHEIPLVLENDYVYVLEYGKLVQEGYRKNLAQETNGPFASFRPVEDDRKSLADSVDSDESDEDFQKPSSTKRRLSALLVGFQEERGLVNSRRMSYGLSSTFANVVRVEDSIAKKEEEEMMSRSASRPQSEHRKLPYNDPSWADSYSQYRPLSSTARTLGLRPQSITSSPPAPVNTSFYNHDSEIDLWRLPSTIPSGIENEMMKRSGSVTMDNRRRGTTARKSPEIQPPMDEIGRMLSPRRFAHRFERLREERPKGNKESTEQRKAASLTQILGTVWPTLVWKDRVILITGFFCAFIHAAGTPAFSYLQARLFQVFYDSNNRSAEARKWSLCILGVAIVDAVATYFMHYLLEYCGQAWVNSIRIEALDRILNQPRSWFDKESNNVGHLNECLDRNAEEMRNLLGRFAGYVFVAVAMMSIAVIWALAVSWKLTLVGLSSAPFLWGVTRCFEYTSAKWEGRSNEYAESAHRIFKETFANIRIVRAFTLEKYFQDKYSTAITQTFKIGLKRATYAGMFFGLSDSANLFVTALIFYYCAVLAAHGNLSISSLFTVVNLLIFGLGNANAIVAFIPQISQSRMTATQLLDLANLSKEASHESLGKTRIVTPLPIKFNSLSFTYPSRPTTQVLHNVSITFPAGSCTSIVGSSGSGKSTIASLILDLYPPTDPSLLAGDSTTPPLTFAGQPIFTLHTPTLRSHIAIVPQTPVLFPTTVAQNIAYGLRSTSPLNTEMAIIQAARDADIHDFIAGLPNGYQTVIGDGGLGLAGGQAQRIVIARALIRRPKVLVLDEATSALDGESADMIRATISRLCKTPIQNAYENLESIGTWSMDGLRMNFQGGGGNGKEIETTGMTVIIITHAVEMMRSAERIVVLDEGRVVEVGGFDELVRRRGTFARLVRGVEYRRDLQLPRELQVPRDLDTVVEVATPVTPSFGPSVTGR